MASAAARAGRDLDGARRAYLDAIDAYGSDACTHPGCAQAELRLARIATDRGDRRSPHAPRPSSPPRWCPTPPRCACWRRWRSAFSGQSPGIPPGRVARRPP